MDLFGRARIAALEAHLTAERHRARTSGQLASELLGERDHLAHGFGPVLQIIRRMDVDYGYPAADIAMDLALDDKLVRASMRTLEALGLARRHPFFSDADNHIRGSGYSLSKAGEKFKRALPPAPESTNGAAAQAVVS